MRRHLTRRNGPNGRDSLMKLVGLVTPEELRIRTAADEAFRVLGGGQAGGSAEAPDDGAEHSSLNITSPAAVDDVRILSSDEAGSSAKMRVNATELERALPSKPAT